MKKSIKLKSSKVNSQSKKLQINVDYKAIGELFGGLSDDEISAVVARKLKKGETRRNNPTTGGSSIVQDDVIEYPPVEDPNKNDHGVEE